MFVLSRPAGGLSVRDIRVVATTVGDCEKAILLVSRSRCFIGRVGVGHSVGLFSANSIVGV